MTWILAACAIVYVILGLRFADSLLVTLLAKRWVRWLVCTIGASAIILTMALLWPLFMLLDE